MCEKRRWVVCCKVRHRRVGRDGRGWYERPSRFHSFHLFTYHALFPPHSRLVALCLCAIDFVEGVQGECVTVEMRVCDFLSRRLKVLSREGLSCVSE